MGHKLKVRYSGGDALCTVRSGPLYSYSVQEAFQKGSATGNSVGYDDATVSEVFAAVTSLDARPFGDSVYYCGVPAWHDLPVAIINSATSSIATHAVPRLAIGTTTDLHGSHPKQTPPITSLNAADLRVFMAAATDNIQ
eukprot:IDg11511t1